MGVFWFPSVPRLDPGKCRIVIFIISIHVLSKAELLTPKTLEMTAILNLLSISMLFCDHLEIIDIWMVNFKLLSFQEFSELEVQLWTGVEFVQDPTPVQS